MHMVKTIVLGLDVSSSRTGFCVIKNGRWTKSKSSFGTIVPVGSYLGEKLVSFRDQLEAVLKRVSPTHVIIEDIFSGPNVSTMKTLARFSGVAIELCRRLVGTEALVVNTVRVRSVVGCGKGKEDAFNYVCKRFHLEWNFNKHNDITDAIILALYQQQLISSSRRNKPV